MPEKFASLSVNDDDEKSGEDGAGKKRQTRGGKGMVKAKKKDKEVAKKIALFIAPRGKKKAVTVVQGLKTFGEENCLSILRLTLVWTAKSVMSISCKREHLLCTSSPLPRYRLEGSVQILRSEIRLRRVHNWRRRDRHPGRLQG